MATYRPHSPTSYNVIRDCSNQAECTRLERDTCSSTARSTLQLVLFIYLFPLKQKQVIWYPKQQPKKTTITRSTYGSHDSPNEDVLEAEDCEPLPLTGDPESSIEEVDRGSEEEMASVCTLVRPNFEFRARLRDIPRYQLILIAYQLLAIAAFSVSICVNTQSAWGIFAPISVAVVLFGAFLYRNYREGRMHFADPIMAWLKSCCKDQPVQFTWLTED